jgi:uncharacterized membrane protein
MMEYKTLLTKIAIDGPTNDKTKEKFDFFHAVQILLKFVVIFPLLQLVHNLIKFSYLCDRFICDFVATTKI